MKIRNPAEIPEPLPTVAVFRTWTQEPAGTIALFPYDPGTNNPATCSSYQHTGQHSSADPGIARRPYTRPATDAEAAELTAELEAGPFCYRITRRRRIPRDAYAKRLAALDLINRNA